MKPDAVVVSWLFASLASLNESLTRSKSNGVERGCCKATLEVLSQSVMMEQDASQPRSKRLCASVSQLVLLNIYRDSDGVLCDTSVSGPEQVFLPVVFRQL